MRRANVAISIAAVPDANIWSSGINQNLAFLVQLLRRSPAVGKLWLVHPGEPGGIPPALEFDTLDVPLVGMHDVTFDVDLVIEMGATLPAEWLRRVHGRGARIAMFLVGHTYAGLAESAMFNKASGATFLGSPWHEVWTLPHHMKTSGPLLRTVSRVPVISMPHVWSPLFLLNSIRRTEQAGRSFGYRPQTGQRRGWRVGIFEPNISVVKNAFIPMLACDEAYRRHPEAVDLMMVLNTVHMKEHRTFNSLARQLDLVRDSRAWFEPRLEFAQCMGEHLLDAIVSHQWECGLNYAYYDALYGGYPLVHNSEWLRDAGMGLYYPGFEGRKAADALVQGWRQEPDYWDDYSRRSRAWLETLAPEHPGNVETFTRRITELMGDDVAAA